MTAALDRRARASSGRRHRARPAGRRAAARAALGSCALWLAAAGCGARVPSDQAMVERFAAPEARIARERAPDMHAAASRARAQAEAAERRGDAPAAADHATRARLLLEAAVAEADRLAFEERRLAAEAREREADEQAARDARARERIDEELAHRESARVAAEQAALAFTMAAEDEARRYRARGAERERLHREAASALVRRANLVVAAAEALEADAEAIVRATTLLEEAGRETTGAAALAGAERAFREAMAALGAARRRRAGPGRDELLALAAAAREAGFEAEQRDEGMVLRLRGVFSGSAAQPSAALRGRLPALAGIVAAHPHGVVQIAGFATAGSAGQRRRLADARAAAAANLLVREGADAARLHSEGVLDATAGTGDAVELVFVAYGPIAH